MHKVPTAFMLMKSQRELIDVERDYSFETEVNFIECIVYYFEDIFFIFGSLNVEKKLAVIDYNIIVIIIYCSEIFIKLPFLIVCFQTVIE